MRKTGESKETCSSRNAISKQQFIRRFGDKLGWGTKKLHQVRIKSRINAYVIQGVFRICGHSLVSEKTWNVFIPLPNGNTVPWLTSLPFLKNLHFYTYIRTNNQCVFKLTIVFKLAFNYIITFFLMLILVNYPWR